MKTIKLQETDKNYKPFCVTSVCRMDLEMAGFDATNVDDDIMERIASKMANAYCNNGFWEALKIFAEDFDVPGKQNAKEIER